MTTDADDSDEYSSNTTFRHTSFSGRISRNEKSPVLINFLHDDPCEMSWSRRAALYLLKRYQWYNPRLKGEDKGESDGDYVELDELNNTEFEHSHHYHAEPSLEKAWAYFDHVTLPRYLYRHHNNSTIQSNDELTLDLAEPGEDRYATRLYHPVRTPMTQLGDFGLGVGLYFSTLRSIAILMVLAGILNIPNMVYYAGSTYSQFQQGVALGLKGSAICTLEEWVPCPTCSSEEFRNAQDRIAVAKSQYYGTETVFAAKNKCRGGADLARGMVNYATLGFILVAFGVMHWYQKKDEVVFDQDEQTAQDYSVVISNPPPDATDAAEWKRYFEEKFPKVHVTCCTVAMDNNELVQMLVQRRELLLQLKHLLPQDTDRDPATLSKVAQERELGRSKFSRLVALVFPDIPEVSSKLLRLNAKLQHLVQSSPQYPATRVFVTFETESAQRRVLSALYSDGFLAMLQRNNINIMYQDLNSKGEHNYLFRSNHYLKVKKAVEPSTVRWQDLGERFKSRALKLLFTSILSACAMALVAYVIRRLRHKSALFSAFAISGFNAAFPQFAKVLTAQESHLSEDRRQTSLYVKITVFRWVNTAIIITMITPFTSTLSNEESDNLLDSVYAIFFAEIVTSNALQLADPVGLFKRHYLAPRAKSQEAMNALMKGEPYDIAERYTNMTKTLFLAFYYCSIFPAAFFMCAAANIINYFADRFSLMRQWKRAPRLGARISKFSMRYFFTAAMVTMAIVSAYTWSGFPYDNLCVNRDESSGRTYAGTWNILTFDGSETAQVSVSNDDTVYRYCLQDLLRVGHGFNFPALPRFQKEGYKWMTDEQATLTSVYGWTSFWLLVLVCLIFFLSFLNWWNEFTGKKKTVGDIQGINFSDVPSISSYIPEIRSDHFPHPFMSADTTNIDEELYEWKDPDRPYSYYDLTRDLREVLDDSVIDERNTKKLFSTVKHWPPEQGEEVGGSPMV